MSRVRSRVYSSSEGGCSNAGSSTELHTFAHFPGAAFVVAAHGCDGAAAARAALGARHLARGLKDGAAVTLHWLDESLRVGERVE